MSTCCNSASASIPLNRVDAFACPSCEAPLDPGDRNPLDEITCPECCGNSVVPGRFEKYRILSRLGQGGMGVVFLAMDESLHRTVAVKAIRKEFGHDPLSREKFSNEAMLAASLTHPNIVGIYHFDDRPGRTHLVMEHIDGQSLDQLLKKKKPLELGFVAGMAIDVARALQAAKSNRLTHSDIKPANILIDNEGTAKLVDFGLAHLADQEVPRRVWGSPYYVAPEKARRETDTPLSDQYSLGVTLWHALAGHRPFRGDTNHDVIRKVLEEPAPPLTSVRPDCPRALAKIIDRMMEKDPARRYPTYRALITDLEKALQPIASPRSPKRKRFRFRATVAAVLLPPLLIGAVFALAGGSAEHPAPKLTAPVSNAVHSG